MSSPLDEPADASVSLPIGNLKPLKQGDLDGFCGLYAGINALRLLLVNERPLTDSEVKKLFGAGITFLSLRNQLACTALVGCDDKLWRKLIKAPIAHAGSQPCAEVG